jgi:hypothetical protein
MLSTTPTGTHLIGNFNTYSNQQRLVISGLDGGPIHLQTSTDNRMIFRINPDVQKVIN